ncbi:hypothetical protein LINPERHAP2_LOCUS30772 [Linum perenne]
MKDLEVLIRISVNRADTVQRLWKYPPPKGSSELLGASDAPAPSNPSAGSFSGDEACVLLSGGGYAEKVSGPAAQLFLVPVSD